MFVIPEEQKEILQRECPEVLEEKDYRRFLLALDDIICLRGMDEEDEMTDYGYVLQDVYDAIYDANGTSSE